MSRRLKTRIVCAMCPVLFRPWCRKREKPATCSVKCARRQTGLSQQGKQLAAATAGRKAQARRRLEDLCGQEFGAFTEREARIFARAFRAGYDRAYPQTWRKRKDAA